MTAEGSAAEARKMARGGAVSFLGAAFSALMGFVLTVILGRLLGDGGAGVVLQAMGVFMIALSLVKLGMDSAAVWYLPRVVRTDPRRIRGALLPLLLPVVVAGTLIGTGAALLVEDVLGANRTAPPSLREAIEIVAWFLPAGAVTMVALSATRGLGGVRAYVLAGNVALPAMRPVAVWVAVVAGTGAVGAAAGWALPFVPVLAVALVVLRSQVRRHEHGQRGRVVPDRSTVRAVFGFALPRTISAGLEQSILWLDVILVGAIAGSSAAGVYGAASRVVMAGLIVDTALRVVVAPRISDLLHEDRTQDVQDLYSVAATWLMLFSAPVYILLAVFAPTVLSLFGEGFDGGASALRILCVGVLLTLCAGNIHSVLLMSGRSGWAAANKALVLAVNVLGNLLLIPVLGIAGAAAVWAFSMLADALLASAEVWRFVGVRAQVARIGYVLCLASVCAGLPAGISVWLLGNTLGALAAAAAGAGVLLLLWFVKDRRRLHLADLRVLTGRK
ncbi:oligosaccharide flippase family protein [Georgenia sp. AZ-5]|uniref:oligosaccharide flippase family protein n=1 Tax=Georgenia sp. AZ-5 TaxID=3367526 RepID=UPI003754C05B